MGHCRRSFKHIYIQIFELKSFKEKLIFLLSSKFQELSIPNHSHQVLSSQVQFSQLIFSLTNFFSFISLLKTLESYKEKVCDLYGYQVPVNFIGLVLPLV